MENLQVNTEVLFQIIGEQTVKLRLANDAIMELRQKLDALENKEKR